jgi:hypothetical protein
MSGRFMKLDLRAEINFQMHFSSPVAYSDGNTTAFA